MLVPVMSHVYLRLLSCAPPLSLHSQVTDEPGYYEDGAFGIRIENVLVVVEAETEVRQDGEERTKGGGGAGHRWLLSPGYSRLDHHPISPVTCTRTHTRTHAHNQFNRQHTFGGAPFLTFEPITLCPLARNLIDTALLTHDELAWVDDYHERVWRVLEPLVAEGRPREWLFANTMPLEQQA